MDAKNITLVFSSVYVFRPVARQDPYPIPARTKREYLTGGPEVPSPHPPSLHPSRDRDLYLRVEGSLGTERVPQRPPQDTPDPRVPIGASGLSKGTGAFSLCPEQECVRVTHGCLPSPLDHLVSPVACRTTVVRQGYVSGWTGVEGADGRGSNTVRHRPYTVCVVLH